MLPAGCVCCSKPTMVLLASHMILISSHTDILHDPHVKQICIPSQHTSAGVTILNVLSSPKQLLLGMHSLKVWSPAPHWMLSRLHWEDRYQASVFEHTNLSCFCPPTYLNPAVVLRFYFYFIFYLALCTALYILLFTNLPRADTSHLQ